MRRLAVTLTSTIALSAVAAPAHADTAVLAGGCFWGMESVFEHVKGVQNVVSGFAGGAARDANYDSVSSERTGHAEAVRITYDPKQISYGQILQIFFTVAHDPTQVNRQGWDIGSQYRSVIFVHDEDQRAAAEASREQVQSRLSRPVATSIEAAPAFLEAEDYHQQYLEKRGLASCTAKLAAVAG